MICLYEEAGKEADENDMVFVDCLCEKCIKEIDFVAKMVTKITMELQQRLKMNPVSVMRGMSNSSYAVQEGVKHFATPEQFASYEAEMNKDKASIDKANQETTRQIAEYKEMKEAAGDNPFLINDKGFLN